MEDIFETITEKRVNNVAKIWNISERDAYELIINFESRQNIKVLPIVINPHFAINDTTYSNITVKKTDFFSCLFKCCR